MPEQPIAVKERAALIGPRVGDGLLDWYGHKVLALAVDPANDAGFLLTTGVAVATWSVQGAAPDITMQLAAKGAGHIVLLSPVDVSGPLHVTGRLTLDEALEFTAADGQILGGGSQLSFRTSLGGAVRATLSAAGDFTTTEDLTAGRNLLVVNSATLNSGGGTTRIYGATTINPGGLDVTGATVLRAALTQSGGDVDLDAPDHTLYVAASSNEVGIGTNAPGSKLDIVQNAGDASLTVRATNQGTGSQTQTQFRAVNAQGAFAYEGMTDGGYTSFAPINGVAGKGSGFWLCYNAARAVFGCQDTGEVQFSIGGGTVGRFDSVGRMAVGASPPSTSYTLHVQGPLGVTGLVSALAGLTANGLITGTAGLTISGGASNLAAQVRVDTTTAVGTHKLVVWGTGAGAAGAVTTAAELGIYGGTGATLMAYASPVEVALQAAAAGTVGRVGSTTNHNFQLLANGTPALVVVPQASGAVGLTVQQQTSGNVGATLFAGGDLVVGDSSHGGFAVPNLSRAYVAYTGAGQSLTANAFTQIQFGTEEKDQRSEYSSNQFQALGTGCYHAEAMLSMAAIATAGDRVVASFFKNGSEYRRFADFTGRNTTDPYSLAGAVTCDLVATDTLDVRVYCYTHGQTTANTFSATTVSWFTVSKIA